MRILIAPDKFKGSLTAAEAAENIEAGLRDVLPDATIAAIPIADGGEGTAEAIHRACGGEWIRCRVQDALGREIEARYLWMPERETAVVEMSEAAGLWRIKTEERDLLRATTYGVGEMILDASRHGAAEIVVGLGGSATNDGGMGMARALGVRFVEGEPAREITMPGELTNLTGITGAEGLDILTGLSRQDRKSALKLIAAVDVRNPLLGARGATRTFGAQKGGTPEQLEILERGLARLASVAQRDLRCDFRETAGAGAAGGLGFGLLSFCGARIRPGFEVVADFVGLRGAIEQADAVITGEGRLDDQTLEGKAPAGVARTARAAGKRVFALVGSTSVADSSRALFDRIIPLRTSGVSVEESMSRAAELLRERARELAGMM
ncbi:MAG TPA: glycerate kinase [Chthoniobacterales bacterium]|jgi:glycerate kinase|nr:glycerate kinase [Chthoniobacterales bacterium]